MGSAERVSALIGMPLAPVKRVSCGAATSRASRRGREDRVKTKVLHAGGDKTWAVVFDTGDEVVRGLTEFAKAQGLGAAHLTAIGAFRSASLGYFEWQSKQYRKIPVDDQVEVLSLVGDVALRDGEPSLHVHAVVGKSDGIVVGGHLLEGYVRPTLEVIVVESPAHLRREHDPVSGLALIRL
jgi:predicted DNA-binding protein with PD1-like motif